MMETSSPEQCEKGLKICPNAPKEEEEEELRKMGEVKEGPDSSSEAFQAILSQVGEFGRWQWRLFFITSISSFVVAFPTISTAFVAVTPEHWCSVPGLQGLNTTYDLRNISIPWEDDGVGHGKYSSCRYYDRDWAALVASGALDGDTLPDLPNNVSTKACHHWVYDHSIYQTTAVEEWDLVCQDKHLASLMQSTYMAGMVFGSLVSEFSDKVGRRTQALFSLLVLMATSLASAFAAHYTLFTILLFFMATSNMSCLLPVFIILTESVGTTGRTIMCMMYHGGFSVGVMSLAGIAYLVRQWRFLQLCVFAPVTVLLIYYWVLPESPRWLLMQGRHQEGLKILSEAAKVNGGSLPQQQELDSLLVTINKERKQSGPGKTTFLQHINQFIKSFSTLLRTRNMRRRCLIMYFAWFNISMMYYGLVYSSENINASVYVLVLLSGAVEIPSFLIVIWTMKKMGRRLNFSLLCTGSGIACLLIMAVPKDLVWMNMTLATVGKFFNSSAFGVAYFYWAELVPTGVRNMAMGTASICGKIGTVLTPFIVDFLGEIHYSVPSTVFGLLSITVGLLDLLLPETGESRLPETIEEVEAMPR
ncbi:organic cation transporter protein-like [Panulirus ornatus]|uniref:organic cation transporter protein-like n=1 Tax=Panulirus ornatus TaxID=150431 RepID=UPI003A8A6B0A